jgi:hypothetical protein
MSTWMARFELAAVVMVLAAVGGAGEARADAITSPTFPGKCLEAFNQGQTLERGAWVRLADCNGSAAQDFHYDFDRSTLSTPGLSPRLCFDLAGPVRNGIGAYLAVCNGSAAQRWDFPWTGVLRPTGVAPDMCLTHFTRAGKPATGWTIDAFVVPECDLGGEGGGACWPGNVQVSWEMALWDCDDRAEQVWRMPAPIATPGCHLGGDPSAAGLSTLLPLLVLWSAARRRRHSGRRP